MSTPPTTSPPASDLLRALPQLQQDEQNQSQQQPNAPHPAPESNPGSSRSRLPQSWVRGMAASTSSVLLRLRAYVWPYRVLSDLTDKSVLSAVLVTGLLGLVTLVLARVSGSVALHVIFVLGLAWWVLGWVWVGRWWWGYRTSPRRDRQRLLGKPGIATGHEISRSVGTSAVVARADTLRPLLAAARAAQHRPVAPQEVALLLGTSRNKQTWLTVDRPVYLVGPPRSGKGFDLLVSHIVEAPGAVVSTSTRADNMELTIGLRAQTGPVLVFDPERVSGRPTTLRWDLLAGCEDPAVAQRRASVLVSKIGLTGDNQVWATSAGGIVQCLLHAAAISGRRASDVHRWSTSPEVAREVVPLLERYSRGTSWSETIAAIQAEDAKMRSNKWFGVETAFKALDVPAVREVFDIDRADAFDPRAFLDRRGTLYLISRWRETSSTGGSVGAFFSLVLDDIALAVRAASQQVSGSDRQDPPCLMVLDEIANIHPWPGLPQATSAGSGEGLQVVSAWQSRSQCRDSYGTEIERSLWDASVILMLGGGSDAGDLKELSGLLGEEAVKSESTTWGGQGGGWFSPSLQVSERDSALISVDQLRRLPEHVVLMVQGRLRPMVISTIPWIDKPWAAQAHASRTWHTDHPAGPDGSSDSYPQQETTR